MNDKTSKHTIRDKKPELHENMDKMKNRGSRVHISVMGYELDRITEVPKKVRADRVYLITRSEEKESPEAILFLKENIKRLEESDIDVIVRRTEPLNLENIIIEMKNIIKDEKRKEVSEIYINVSSGSSVGAIAGTLCSMLHSDENTKITPYYVIPEEHFENLSDLKKLDRENEYRDNGYDGVMPRTFGVYGLEYVTPFEISLPDEKLMIFVKRIYETKSGISMKGLAELIIQKPKKETSEKELSEDKKLENEIKDLMKTYAHKKYNHCKYSKEDIERIYWENKTLLNWRKSRVNVDLDEDDEQIKKLIKDKPEPVDYVWLKQNVLSKLKNWGLIEISEERNGGYKIVTLTKKGTDLVKYLY